MQEVKGMLTTLKDLLLGKPLNPLHPHTRQHIALITLFAWVGLGADALSSSCYGPEQSYLALGAHHQLAIYIAVITVMTIFIISIGYNQVITLFPGGGGGYKVATKLLHPYAGLVSGAALLVDYVLTIAVSIASGTDALFSLLPIWLHSYKLGFEVFLVAALLGMNLRGMKETIQVLFPIFLGFIILHASLIIYGIIAHSKGLLTVIPLTISETQELAKSIGWLSVIGLTLHAYSLGSGTYTGLEAVSNNVQTLAEPRVETGKRTMLYMAISLSFTAGGIILLYLLWHASAESGQTLNAIVFHSILGNSLWGNGILVLTLGFEAGLLLIAANTGFAAGPGVLANMAVDGWIPNRFRHLSNRLVVQNGLILFGIAAILILFWAEGKVNLLVVLYSINVFITFTLTLIGISVYWIKHRTSPKWFFNFIISTFSCLVTASILIITLLFKFAAGGWLTLLLTSSLVGICLLIKRHYQYIAKMIADLDERFRQPLHELSTGPLVINPQLPTAMIFVNNFSVGMHTFLTIIRMFPGLFKNFVFLSAGTVDVESFKGQHELELMQQQVDQQLAYFVKYCSQLGLPAEGYSAFGTDTIEELKILSDKVGERYPNGIFFSSQIIFSHENLLTRMLHSQTPLILQHHIHFHGRELMILPMRI